MRRIYQFCSKIPTDKVGISGPRPLLKDLPKHEAFQKLDLRIGNITKVEIVEGASTLYRVDVELGTETRSVVTGLSQLIKPEDMIGLGVLLTNIKKRKLAGVESNGMLLVAKVGEQLELLRPTGNVGDKLFIDQDVVVADSIIHKKVWDKVKEDFKTDENGFVTHLDKKLKTKTGEIKSKLKNATIS